MKMRMPWRTSRLQGRNGLGVMMAIAAVAAVGLGAGLAVAAARQNASLSDVTAAAPAASGKIAASPTARYSHSAGGWSVDYPSDWQVSPWMLNGAAFTSYDPAQAVFERGVAFETAAATPPTSEVRVQVEVRPTQGLDLAAFTGEFLGSAAPADATYRMIETQSASVGGLPAHRLNVYERGTQLREALYWIFTTDDGRAFVIHAWPARTTRLAQVQELVDSFKVRTGVAGVVDPLAVARTRRQLYVLSSSPSFTHAGGGYISTEQAVSRAAAFATRGPITKQEVHLLTKGEVDAWLGSDDANVAKDREVYVVILQTPYVPDRGMFAQTGCGYLIAVIDAVTAQVHGIGGCGRPLGTGNWPVSPPLTR